MNARIHLKIFAALTLALAATPAWSTTQFGSLLTPTTQPANAGAGIYCKDSDHGAMCTQVMTEARNRPNSAVSAPKDGTIARLRLIACFPGSFVFQTARVQLGTQNARVVRTGPAINYLGDPSHCTGERYRIEEFAVSVPVTRGDVLAVLATKIGFVYSAGDNGSLLFIPPLADGAPVRAATGRGNGIILLQAFYDD